MRRDIKLIAFDLEGVLTDGAGCWREIHRALGTLKKAEIHHQLFRQGKISFDRWALSDAKLWKGTSIEKIKQVMDNIMTIRGMPHTISRLKQKYKLAIISGGLDMLANRIKDRYGFDYAYANEIITEDGKFISVRTKVGFEDKGRILKEILDAEDIRPENCAAVGDYINDISMFKHAGFSIAFDPKDERILEYADEVIFEKNLSLLLKYL